MNTRLWIVTLLVAATLCTMLFLQVQLLNRSINTNRQISHQRREIISKEIGDSFRMNETIAHRLPALVKSDPEKLLEKSVDEVVSGIFMEHNMRVDYQYGIYIHSAHEHQLYELVTGTTPMAQLKMKGKCDQVCKREFVLTALTCGHHYGQDNKFHLAVFFKEKNSYVVSEVGGELAISFIFIILIAAAFVTLVLMIRKQKRIAEMKDDFINNLTHEFKTPIFSIDLAAGILKKSEQVKSSEKLVSYVNLISTEAERLKTQVDTILQMSLVDSGNFRLEKKSTDIHQLISTIVNHFDLIVKERGGKFILYLDSKIKIIQADPLHLKNAINNLIDNAIKYNTGNPVITISTFDSGSEVSLAIQDNGIGMNKTVQNLVFKKFYRAQASNVHDIKGFGLGLSYVKQIIDAHRGHINLKSAENSGSEFIISLPSA